MPKAPVGRLVAIVVAAGLTGLAAGFLLRLLAPHRASQLTDSAGNAAVTA